MARRRLDDLDYYELLGVERDAPLDVIKQAFHRFARKYHPDRAGDDEEAVRRRVIIYRRGTEAYRTLTNPERRRAYDHALGQGELRFESAQLRASRRPSMSAGLGDVQSSRARPFALKAQHALRVGNYPQARLNLQIALSHEPDNGDLQAQLRRVEAHLQGK